jgi:hypothetical protein
MSRYSAAGTVGGTNTAGTQLFTLQANSAAANARIREIGVNVAVSPSTAPAFYISRQTVAGTATTTLAGQPNDPATTVTSSYNFISMGGNGTFSTSLFIRYGGLSTTAGGMLIWTFYDDPLIVTPGSGHGITIVNANASGATTGTFTGYMCWDE